MWFAVSRYHWKKVLLLASVKIILCVVGMNTIVLKGSCLCLFFAVVIFCTSAGPLLILCTCRYSIRLKHSSEVVCVLTIWELHSIVTGHDCGAIFIWNIDSGTKV